MSLIKVTSEDLQTLSSQVMGGSNSIQEQLSQLKSQVNSIEGSWQGSASAQFQDLYAEWDRSAAGLKDALDGISTLLGHASTSYQGTENAVASSFHG
jgi:WXG100 family type VII secretion target